MNISNYIQIISIPRSGQNMFQRLLERTHYYYNLPFSYCEYYGCCGSIPCKKGSLFLKNHDFSLNLKKTDQKYIVLYRKDAVSQMESMFRFDEKKNIDYEKSDNFERFIEYYRNHISYYHGFLLKWAENGNPNIFLMEYNDFCKNPALSLSKMIVFLGISNGSLSDVKNILSDFEEIKIHHHLDAGIYNKMQERISQDSYFSKLFKTVSKIRMNNINAWNARLLWNYVLSRY